MTREERDDITMRFAKLRAGSKLHVTFERHTFLLMLTNEFGLHTGRSRFLVVCTTCEKLIHEATTGPMERIEQHIDMLKRQA